MQILTISRKSTSQFYYENIFKVKTLDWENIYLLPTNTILDNAFRMFYVNNPHNGQTSQLLLILKYCTCKARESKSASFNDLKNEILKFRDIEQKKKTISGRDFTEEIWID